MPLFLVLLLFCLVAKFHVIHCIIHLLGRAIHWVVIIIIAIFILLLIAALVGAS